MDANHLPTIPVDPFLTSVTDWMRPAYWSGHGLRAMDLASSAESPRDLVHALAVARVAFVNVVRVTSNRPDIPLVDLSTGETVSEYAARVVEYRRCTGNDGLPGETPIPAPPVTPSDAQGSGGSKVPARPPRPIIPRPGGQSVPVPVP